jgi:hypothetical protein
MALTTPRRPKEAHAVLTIRVPITAYIRLEEQAVRDNVRPSTQAQRLLVRALSGRRSEAATAT